MQNSRDEKFNQLASELGYSFDGEIKIGGNYVSAVRHKTSVEVYQLPKNAAVELDLVAAVA